MTKRPWRWWPGGTPLARRMARPPPILSGPSRKARRCRRWAGLDVDPCLRQGVDAITSGIEDRGPQPTTWDNGYFDVLFGYEWELTKSPAGANQWTPKADAGAPEAAPGRWQRTVPLMMTTADMAMRMDPAYGRSPSGSMRTGGVCRCVRSRLVQADPPRYGPQGPLSRPDVPEEDLIWQDPVPAVEGALIGAADIAKLKGMIAESGFRLPIW